jgi:hypothetical protein
MFGETMSRQHQIEFVLSDKVNGVEVTPTNIGLDRFNEFNQQVADFIAGSERLKLDEVHVTVGAGSYKLTAVLPLLIVTAIEPDLQRLSRQDSLGEIDPKRAEVVARWQARSKTNPDVRYLIQPHGVDAKPIQLSTATDYRIGTIVPWVKVEKYLFGTVMDMGGAQKANVHVRLEDSGQVVRVGTNQDYLKNQKQNRLYRKVLVRVEADQHYKTGELRNLRLLAFEDYESKYDKGALDRFAEAGKRAWADVPDAAAWVRQLRGGA